MSILSSLEKQGWFQKILHSEGGYNPNEPVSVGGESYAGITQASYDAWRKKTGNMNTPEKVKELAGKVLGTRYEKMSPLDIPADQDVKVETICAFYEDYFKPAGLDLVPECLKYIHADFFVNAGFTANKVLQRMCGMEADGIIGKGSRAALANLKAKLEADIETDPTADDDLIMIYHQEKLKHYRGLVAKNPETYEKWLKGWEKRAQHVLSELGDYFEDSNPTQSAVDVDEHIDHDMLFDGTQADTETDSDNDIIDKMISLLQKLKKGV